eukprot:gnl/TRDRNA2_/TRDRNA2_177895_c0_seq5.p1 gnl/TRDRNA2_/TRDRNA2_177895_c0~~gnl/TRDRNA2_/TRDRNA2_177895_c0_seq5.p1  ORF type:complete len:416 (+),score=-36.63 gnl/TRDRNA2_/TRDRNA2_177895_c0_seq5:128-1375(+)
MQMCINEDISPFSFITRYKMSHPEVRKIYYCTKTLHDQLKAIAKFCQIADKKHTFKRMKNGANSPKLVILGLVSEVDRASYLNIIKNLHHKSFISPRRLKRFKSYHLNSVKSAMKNGKYFNTKTNNNYQLLIPSDAYSLNTLWSCCQEKAICPHFLTHQIISIADIIVCNHQCILDPKINKLVFNNLETQSILFIDEAQDIGHLSIEAFSSTLSMNSLNIVSSLKLFHFTSSIIDKNLYKSSNNFSNQLIMSIKKKLPNGKKGKKFIKIPSKVRNFPHFMALLRRSALFCKQKILTHRSIVCYHHIFRRELETDTGSDATTLELCNLQILTNFLGLLTAKSIIADELNVIIELAEFISSVKRKNSGLFIIISTFKTLYSVSRIKFKCINESLAVKALIHKFCSVIITSSRNEGTK